MNQTGYDEVVERGAPTIYRIFEAGLVCSKRAPKKRCRSVFLQRLVLDIHPF